MSSRCFLPAVCLIQRSHSLLTLRPIDTLSHRAHSPRFLPPRLPFRTAHRARTTAAARRRRRRRRRSRARAGTSCGIPRRSPPLTEEPPRTMTASAPSQLSSDSLASFPSTAAPKSLPHTCHGKPSEWMTVCLVVGCHFAQAVTKCSRVSRRTSPLFNYSHGLERPSKSSPKVCAPQQESTTSSAQHGRGH